MPLAAEAHRLRDVEQHGEVRVRVGLVLLDVEAIGAREQPPVDAADVVARRVAAVLGEVHRRAEVRRAVQAVDEAVDHRARHQLEVADAGEHHRVDEARTGQRAGWECAPPSQTGTRRRHGLEQPIDERVAGDPLRLRVEVGQHAVAQHRVRERADVLEADVIAAGGQRPRLAAEDRGTAPRARWRRTPPIS